MYKYSCRKCPIRERCIEESNNPESVKTMVRAAFSAKTDTLATWGLLQKRCLLVEAEQSRSQSALSDRLRRVQATQSQEDEPISSDQDDRNQVDTSILGQRRNLSPPSANSKPPFTSQSQQPDYLKPVTPPEAKRPPRPLKRISGTKELQGATRDDRYWLTVMGTGRHIALPVEGELSLGRFDPNVGIPPDIDFSFEDRNAQKISRRHASIIGRQQTHTVQDLGSRTGVYVNGQPVETGTLAPKDRLTLGGVHLIYDKIPPDIFEKAKSKDVLHTLTVTPTGRRFRLPPNRTLVVGRADPQVDFKPDIDLTRDGEAARLVSRRHIQLYWRYGQLYVEDLGSRYGTRLKGQVLALGQAVPLKPGDHVWVAGCVLAYDIETGK
ncbi:MAG TPA: FHA domain-containing protein [Anaerolineae bacterium]|nr:FHA domain-containing protein [Anaerolineae bacterium]HMR65899.1 FHA domain-containing protein [Anaerolineae bacterium]